MKKILIFFLVAPIFFIFRSWLELKVLTATDFPFIFPEKVKEFLSWPFAWSATRIGENITPFLFTYLPWFSFGAIGNSLGFAWTERIVWFFPFLILSVFSSWYLFRILFPKNTFWILSSLVLLFNSYILMVVGGGQMGLALSYSLFPLILARFIQFIDIFSKGAGREKLGPTIILGLLISVQVMFDPRIAYITSLALFFYAFLHYSFIRRFSLLSILYFFISYLVVLGLHFYWILPSILAKSVSLPATYNEPRWVEFLSFAQFSNSFSLLHPNWPENIFGKIYFMRWEFLIIPIIAYGGLLFTRQTRSATNEKRIDTNILFFALLGLLGAFLAKGANPPFGEVYLWLFNNFPGMNLFRDPTKFYTLVALSYSVLIPFSISKIYGWIKSQTKFSIFNFQNLFLIFAITYLLFLIRPAWTGELGGTFKSKPVPKEYVELKDFLASQPEFFRTLWVPKKQRFGFYSNNHPVLSSQEFVSPGSCQSPFCSMVDQTKKPPKLDPVNTPETEILDQVRNYSLSYFKHLETPGVLGRMGVKYVIVPSDSEGEIFLQDRKYSEAEREKYLQVLNRIPWLQKIDFPCSSDTYHCSGITIYQTPNYQDHFFASGEKSPGVVWKMLNPTRYVVEVKNVTQPFTLVFSETYDPLWQAKIGEKIIPSEKLNETFNSFQINQRGDFEVVVEFAAQKYVWWGLVVSLGTLITAFLFLLRAKIAPRSKL